MGKNLYGAPWSGYTQLGKPIDWNRMSVPIGVPTILGPKMKGNPLQIDTKPKSNKNGIDSGDIMNIAGSALSFGKSVYNGFQYNRTADDLMQQAGRLSSSVGGIGYEMQNNINEMSERNQEHKENVANTFSTMGSGAALGGSIGSIAGPIGGAIGAGVGAIGGLVAGLFGSGRRHAEMMRRIREAQGRVDRANNFNRDVAMTTKLQMDFGRQYGNQDDQILFAKHGKDVGSVGKNIGYGLVSTADGIKFGNVNAIGHNGEAIGEPDPETGLYNWTSIKTGTGKKENAPLNVSAETGIIGKDFEKMAKPFTNALDIINSKINSIKDNKSREIAERASAATKRKLNSAVTSIYAQQEMLQNQDYTESGLRKYKNGKSGKIGWTTNFIPSTLGMLLGIGQYFDAKNQNVYRPNTYVRNPYEQRAIAELDALRINPYPITREMRNAESRMNYALNNSGGLSGAQKYIGRIANYNNLYNSIANMYGGIQEKNNAYRSAAAQAKLTAGAQDATNRMNALRADNDIYMKSHAAREAGMQTGLYNFMNYLTNYAKSENQRLMYNGMYDLYAQDRELERERLRRG